MNLIDNIKLSSRSITSDLTSRLPVLVQQYKRYYPELSDTDIETNIRELNQYDPTGDKASFTPVGYYNYIYYMT